MQLKKWSRQPSNDLKFNRQPSKKVIQFLPSKMQIDVDRQKVSRHFNLGCFSISADRAPLKIKHLIVMDFWLLKNRAPNWKTSSHVLKNTPSRHYKTLELAYI